ncbi:MAG: radical SAM protein [Sulfurisoma sp.]|nr:radical SAM protein [Sulfurisoma sp.]
MAAAVGQGIFRDGYAHYASHGRREGRNPAWVAMSGRTTRHCLDPWNYLEITPALGLKPCCNIKSLASWSAAGEDPGSQRNSRPFRELRMELLSGNLREACRRCHIRPRVAVEVLETEVARLVGGAADTGAPLRSLRVELTTKCNLRCVYCLVSHPLYEGRHMGPDGMAAVRDLVARERSIEEILLNGHGESTFHPEWMSFFRDMALSGRPLSIISNLARPLSREQAGCLALCKLIQVSLDTVDPRLLSQLRRRVKLENVTQNIARVREEADRRRLARPTFTLSCGIFDHSAPGLADLARFAVEQGMASVTFWPLVEHPELTSGIRVRAIPELAPLAIRQAIESLNAASDILRKAGIGVEIAGNFIEDWGRRLDDPDCGDSR